jgi:hypothetical protein
MKVASIVLNSLILAGYFIAGLVMMIGNPLIGVLVMLCGIPCLISIIVICTSNRRSGGFIFQGIMDILFGFLISGIMMLCIEDRDLAKGKKTIQQTTTYTPIDKPSKHDDSNDVGI